MIRAGVRLPLAGAAASAAVDDGTWAEAIGAPFDPAASPLVLAGLAAERAITGVLAAVVEPAAAVLGEYDVTLTERASPGISLRTTACVAGLHSKGTGTLVSVNAVTTSDDDSAAPVAEQWWRVFVPGATGATFDSGTAGPAPGVFDGAVINRPPAAQVVFEPRAAPPGPEARRWLVPVHDVAAAVSGAIGAPLGRLSFRFRRPVQPGMAVRADVWAAPARSPVVWFECWSGDERVVGNGAGEIVR